MPRTPYQDPEAEKAYQDMQDNSSKVSAGHETFLSVNAGAKTSKGFDKLKPLPNTDDNTFFSSESDGNIIRAKRKLRDGLSK